MKKIDLNIKKSILVTLCSFMIMSLFCQNVSAISLNQFETKKTFILMDDGSLLPLSEAENLPCPLAYDCSERITLGSYVLSKKDTKELANNMRNATGGWAIIGEAFFGALGLPATIIAAGIALSANAQFRSDVVYAADHNKRVRVTITDSKYCHTSYSTHTSYQVVD